MQSKSSGTRISLRYRGLLVTLVLTFLALVFILQSVSSMRQKSVTPDEIMYIAAGYYHLKTGDFQLNMTNPPLIKMISALPLLTLDPQLPATKADIADLSLVQQWQFAREFLYQNRVDADVMLTFARLPIIALALILGGILFIWSKELYGVGAGLVALLLFAFSPNILAHSRLATQDLAITAFMFITAYFYWRFANRPSAIYLLLTGVVFGIALITKSTAVLLIPVFIIYSLISIQKEDERGIYERFPLISRINTDRIRLRQFVSLTFVMITLGIIAIIVVNIGYGFQGTLSPLAEDHYDGVYNRLPVDNVVVRQVADLFLRLPLPFPRPYVESLIFSSGLGSSGNVYFAGQIYESGLWYLMIVSYLIKTPISAILLFIMSIILLVKRRNQLDAEWLAIIVIVLVFFLFSVQSTFTVGVRYGLPVYPFVFLLASSLFGYPFKYRRLVNSAFLILLGFYVLNALMIYPHYLSYFNELVGGPKNGYKYLADSNIDWGQDLKGLKKYMDENGIEEIKLAYFGSADAAYYGIDYEYLPSVGLAPIDPGQYWWYEIDSDEKSKLEPQTGTIAISATLLASPGWMQPLFRDSYAWLKDYEPVDQVGYSILIYEIDELE